MDRLFPYTIVLICMEGAFCMTNMTALLLLAFAVSLDSFGVGFTYGLRKMKMPLQSILIIACMSVLTILISMLIGTILSNFLSPVIASRIGGVILILLGLWITFQTFRSSDERESEEQLEEKVIASFEMKLFGIVISILKKPMDADMDRSGAITGREAFLLGVALSFDAFGAGLGAAMLGFSPLVFACLIGVMSALFLKVGMTFGNKLAYKLWVSKLAFLPGILLVLIGILKW